MKRIAIVQSNYIPWKGYFDLLASVDAFILYDAVQFTRRDWRNRNRVKTAQGLQWLTVPVLSKGRYDQAIDETEVDGAAWAARHWRAIESSYARAPHFDRVAAQIEPVMRSPSPMLSEVNRALIGAVAALLGIETPITNCRDYTLVEGKTERLVALCQQAGGDVYVSGPAAKAYLDGREFTAAGLAVEWFDYSGYPEYPQLWGDFVHEVSILDMLFNTGPDAPQYMKCVR